MLRMFRQDHTPRVSTDIAYHEEPHDAGTNPAPKRPHRLSKPRTNTNSASPASSSTKKSPYSTYAWDNEHAVEDPASEDGQGSDSRRGSPDGWQQRSRVTLNMSREDVRSSTMQQNEDAPVFALRQGRLSAPSPNASSTQLALPRTPKLGTNNHSMVSLVSDGQPPVDLQAAIKLLQELSKNASPEDLVALRRI